MRSYERPRGGWLSKSLRGSHNVYVRMTTQPETRFEDVEHIITCFKYVER
jgi:hypothetical protein